MPTQNWPRQSLRLQDYDYSLNGAYFLTLVSRNRANIFGDIVQGEMALSDIGKIVLAEWANTPTIRKEVAVDEFIIMPNHLHGIIVIHHPDMIQTDGVTDSRQKPLRQPRSVGSFVAGFKSSCTAKINRLNNSNDMPVWQRNYYEHIIRTEEELRRIREYIQFNPARWEMDEENPNHSR